MKQELMWKLHGFLGIVAYVVIAIGWVLTLPFHAKHDK